LDQLFWERKDQRQLDRIDRMGRIFFAWPDAGPKESTPPAAEGVFAFPSGKSKKNLIDPVNPD
jgi:hypothetical protein